MLALRRPAPEALRRFVDSFSALPFTYAEVGASRQAPLPAGYVVDHNRILLGHGPDSFQRAVAALHAWRMFDTGWTELLWPDTPLAAGSVFGILVRPLGLWSLNACRIVYLVDERGGPVERHGFAYGTLPGHVESGEERFLVERRRAEDDSVWYDLLAFSRPGRLLTRLGYPVARLYQKRFARDSKRAMLSACRA